MAVSVELIVNNYLAFIKKSQSGGYITSPELNGFFKAINVTLFQYYFNEKNKGSKSSEDALQPFLKSTTLNYTNGTAVFPTDYYMADTCLYTWTMNTPTGIEVVDIPVPFVTQSEYSGIIKDGNRKPNILKQRAYYSFVNNLINIYPRSVTATEFIYYRPPADAVYATTTVSTSLGTFQQFDAANSVNFEWDLSQQENISDLLLFFGGVMIRETAIVQYAQMKQHESLIR